MILYYFPFDWAINRPKESSSDHIIRRRPSQMCCKLSVFKVLENFQENNFLRVSFLVKLQKSKTPKLSQGKTCAGVSFLMKFQAGRTMSTSNCWYTFFFFNASFKKNQGIFHHLRSVLLIITGKSGNCFNSANIISNVAFCGDGLLRYLKNKRDNNFGSMLPR